MSSRVRYTDGMSFLRSLLALALLASPLAVGCSQATNDWAGAAGSSDQDITAGQLAGEYAKGRGMFSSLKFERVRESGHLHNLFESDKVVMCVRAPCPANHLTGRWFASGTFLRLYPDSEPAMTFRFTLVDGILTMRDDRGNELAELERVVAPAGSAAALLAARGLEKVSIELPADEAARQAKDYPSKVSFDDAVAEALDSFLTDADDPESPLGLAAYVDADDPCRRATDEETLKCIVDDPSTTFGMLKAGESAEHGEEVSDAWIFTLSIPNLSDHGHWAIVDRSGKEATYNYGFN